MKYLLLLLTLTSLLLTACGDDAATVPPEPINTPTEISTPEEAAAEGGGAEREHTGQFREADCPFVVPAGVVIDCGYLIVPENRSKPDTPDIELAVAILRASGEEVQPDPIIFLEGGPGGSALISLNDDLESWTAYPFHQNRDQIFIDQRGTGYSKPSLDCPEEENPDYENTASEDLAYEATQACHDRLVGQGVDLSAYNTAENGADIAGLRKALGYDQVNLFGISYGTRLGLVVMRDQPEGIRSVVLDSPFPPNADTPVEDGLNIMDAFRTLFKGCASDPACYAAYPDLETVLLETVARLNESPDPVELTNPDTGEVEAYEIYGDDVADTLVQALYDVELIPLLPRLIYELSQGNYDTYSLVAPDTSGAYTPARFQEDEDRSDSEGMHYSVMCRDEYAFGDYDEAEEELETEIPTELQTALFGASANLFTVCDMWGAGQAGSIENQAVVSDIPTLILVGEYDPVTPPRWGKLTAQTLGKAYLFELPGFGHSLSSDPGCPTNLISQFFDDPTTKPDSSCVNELNGPDFFLPGEAIDF